MAASTTMMNISIPNITQKRFLFRTPICSSRFDRGNDVCADFELIVLASPGVLGLSVELP